MKTGIEIVDIVSKFLETSVLMSDANKPSGSIYKFQRPANSIKEDVVVNLIAQGRGVIAEGGLNVNIYVPNLSFKSGDTTDNSRPNVARLRYLSKLTSDLLHDVWDEEGEYTFEVLNDTVYPDAGNQHYSNLRVQFYSLN